MPANSDMLTGQTVGHYAVGDRLGEGGMGVVYRALDTRLNRTVALKCLPADLEVEPDRRRRFVHEAQTASALNHPHIVTIYDIDSAGRDHFIVMELVEGTTLRDRIAKGPLPVAEAVGYAVQIADALAAAHAQGIVHRDLKPANVMVTSAGIVKVLDFGLAKLTQAMPAAVTQTALTQVGAVVGTAAYMSPEQTEGRAVDARSDIFAFGAVVYEMLTGRQAFAGTSVASVLSAIHRDEPKPLGLSGPNRSQLEEIVFRCLRKDPSQRFQRIDDVKAQLQAWNARTFPSERVRASRPMLRFVAAVAVLTILGASGWLWRESRNTAWAYGQLQEIRRLTASYDYSGALALSEATGRYIRDDAELAQLIEDASRQVRVETDPAGATVAIRPYGSTDADWRTLGVSPIQKVRVPRGQLEWRFSNSGYRDTHIFTNAQYVSQVTARMFRFADLPQGMVYIPGAKNFPLTLLSLTDVQIPIVREFYLGQYEVTNAEFKRFVDQGGYRNPAYWKYPFRKDGVTIPFSQAIPQFTDATGLPGPATWKLGTFPDGAGDVAVGGVSWYEAAAYAEFAGRSLPTVVEWNLAAGPWMSPQAVAIGSNFGGKGPSAVRAGKGLNPFGTYDMAGNVKEWCLNEDAEGSGRRYILGGGWDDPDYRFLESDVRSSFDRAATNGIRLVSRPHAPPSDNTRAMTPHVLDYIHRKPASDAEFRIYASLHAYDRASRLNQKVEQRWDEPHWTKERITFDAAYNGERIAAFLFLPKNSSPPFQTLIYWPGTGAQAASNSDILEMNSISFLIQRGRAVLYPIYKGTYERGANAVVLPGSMSHRDLRIQQYQDFARSLDYLETRQDIDSSKFGFYGLSWGGGMGAYVPALEKRLKASVLIHAGYRMIPYAPEVDPFNFAPHVTIPTLMLSGEYDSTFPAEMSQLPMYRQLGTPAADKKRSQFKIGHEFLPTEFAKETLAWFDRYLGEVKQQ